MPGPKQTEEAKAKYQEMAELYKSGIVSNDIGRRYGVSGSRVMQILGRMGIGRDQGGKFARSINSQMKKQQEKRADKFVASFGCLRSVALEINGGISLSAKGTPAFKYKTQRRTAITRGIEWKFTFPEWMRVWLDSGHWEHRGRWHGYVMARIADTGPYSADNVEIVTQSQNIKDSFIKSPWIKRFPTGIMGRGRKPAPPRKPLI